MLFKNKFIIQNHHLPEA